MMGIGLFAAAAVAAPFDGCTLLSPRLVQGSWPGGLGQGCANLSVVEGGCVKVKMTPAGPVTYPGDRITGRLPTHFIETTARVGTSVFAEAADGLALRPQLALAREYWTAVLGRGLPVKPAGDGVVVDPVQARGFLHARALAVPYGRLVWSFPEVGHESGAMVPTCFSGLSELAPRTWADVPGHPDTPLVRVHALTNATCALPGPPGRLFEMTPRAPDAAAVGALTGAAPTGASQSVLPCAVPQPAAIARARALAKAAQTKRCVGRLGPHLPRTGAVSALDPWPAATLVAVRLATLAEAHWGTGPGLSPGDRWQQVWPPATGPGAHACFVPGERTEGPPHLPLPQSPHPDDVYVFATWRPFSTCAEPGQGAAFRATARATHLARTTACAAFRTKGFPP